MVKSEVVGATALVDGRKCESTAGEYARAKENGVRRISATICASAFCFSPMRSAIDLNAHAQSRGILFVDMTRLHILTNYEISNVGRQSRFCA